MFLNNYTPKHRWLKTCS